MTRFHHLAKRGEQPQKKKSMTKQGKIMVANMTIIGLLGCLAIGYIVTINGLATKGYQLKALDQQIAELSAQNRQLELSTVELKSTQAVAARLAELDMVAVDKPAYISGAPVVAVR